MTRTVKRTGMTGGVGSKFTQYLTLGAEATSLTARAGVLKKDLMSFVETNGTEDDKGHRLHTLDTPVSIGGKTYIGFQRQRRLSQTFNPEKAQELCEEKGFEKDEFISTEEYVDQDKIARLYAEDRLTEEEFASLIDESESFAFVAVKE